MSKMEELSALTAKILNDVSYTNEIVTILDILAEEKQSEILTITALSSLKKVSLSVCRVLGHSNNGGYHLFVMF